MNIEMEGKTRTQLVAEFAAEFAKLSRDRQQHAGGLRGFLDTRLAAAEQDSLTDAEFVKLPGVRVREPEVVPSREEPTVMGADVLESRDFDAGRRRNMKAIMETLWQSGGVTRLALTDRLYGNNTYMNAAELEAALTTLRTRGLVRVSGEGDDRTFVAMCQRPAGYVPAR